MLDLGTLWEQVWGFSDLGSNIFQGFSAECVCGVIPNMLPGFVVLPLEGRELSIFNWRYRHKIYEFKKKKRRKKGPGAHSVSQRRRHKNLSGLLIPDVP